MLSESDKIRIMNAVGMQIRIHGLPAVQRVGAEQQLKFLLDPRLQKQALAKCGTPEVRKEVERRFEVLENNRVEALEIIKGLLDPEFKQQKMNIPPSKESYLSSAQTEKEGMVKEQP